MKTFLDANFAKTAADYPGIINTPADRDAIKQFIYNTLNKTSQGQIELPMPAGTDPYQMTGDLINTSHSKDPSTGVITYQADVQLNLVTTTVLNTYFDTNVFTPGMILGHLVSQIQTKKVIGL